MDLAKSKLADIVQHCIYEIATGKWPPRLKLPSVREAEKLWGVNRLTVLSAYRELEKIGLVKSKNRSGYYVTENDDNEVLDTGLIELYDVVKILINKRTDFDLSYAFRYFNAMAISESRTNPVYAFLECTLQQAEDHANEIYQKLNVLVRPICLCEDDTLIPDIPESVQTLMTTGFHIKEVRSIGKKLKKRVVNISIEVDPGIFNKIRDQINKAIVVELENNMSSNISSDIRRLMERVNVEAKLVKNIEKDILSMIADPANQLILVSPRIWGRSSPIIKKDKKVKLIRFRISDASWRVVSRALKIPFHGAA